MVEDVHDYESLAVAEVVEASYIGNFGFLFINARI